MWVGEREGLSEKIWEFEKEEKRERERKRKMEGEILWVRKCQWLKERKREREREQNKTWLWRTIYFNLKTKVSYNNLKTTINQGYFYKDLIKLS